MAAAVLDDVGHWRVDVHFRLFVADAWAHTRLEFDDEPAAAAFVRALDETFASASMAFVIDRAMALNVLAGHGVVLPKQR